MSLPHACPGWRETGNPLFLWVREARKRAVAAGKSPVFYFTETRGFGMAAAPRWYVIQQVLRRCLKHRRLTVHQHNALARQLFKRYGGNHGTFSRVVLQGFGYAVADEYEGISCTVNEYEISQKARAAFWQWCDKVRNSKSNPFADVWDEQNATLIMLQEAKCVVSHPNRELMRLRNESAEDDGRTVRSLGKHHGRSNQRGCEA